ncbi:MAG: acyl-CoA dehydratase activase [Desulfomonilaceae bacterium]|nr:acyl-CoA dehydratase activase [Desulfomonilaceae bacterium]
MNGGLFLGLDCGSVSLNIVILDEKSGMPVSRYLRTGGRPRETLVSALQDLSARYGDSMPLSGACVTGSGRALLSECLGIPAINEISAHAVGAFHVNPAIRTIIEIGGQDSKFIRIAPPETGAVPRIVAFRMNEICAAGTGSFLDEQADRLGIPVESFHDVASRANEPAAIAGRCAVFAKTDMIHQAQEGVALPEILLGAAYALARNYIATLIRGDSPVPLVSLQGGVMANASVVNAFRDLLGLSAHEIVIPPHFTVLGALGCAVTARRDPSAETIALAELRRRASKPTRSLPTVNRRRLEKPTVQTTVPERAVTVHEPPYVMGLDVGSVSVKGVVIDTRGSILAADYRLSSGRPLEALQAVIDALSLHGPHASVRAVTGSGRILAGRLIRADLTVNEISAQARAAVSHDPDVDTIVEIGGQDSKWISLEGGTLKDFEMNRVCAAGTGSFLMEQADRLGLHMGEEFSEAAFSSDRPSDLGTRCTVFMESDLIHHQNNGSSRGDLAAGVCLSVVRNYMERVANHKAFGRRILFLGGVAANDAVRSAFQQETGRVFHSPPFHKVSGALGAALKAVDGIRTGDILPHDPPRTRFDVKLFTREQFSCSGCPNECRIDRYSLGDGIVFHGGRCDRWEAEAGHRESDRSLDLLRERVRLLEGYAPLEDGADRPAVAGEDRNRLPSHTIGMIRSPHFYEWFPFWDAFWRHLGFALTTAPPPDRRQFEQGTRFLRVETCLPMKLMAGQVRVLADRGVRTIFHPAILSERPLAEAGKPAEHCPYIQASSQFVKGSFDVTWLEPLVNFEHDADSFRNEHVRLAQRLGATPRGAVEAYEAGMAAQAAFESRIESMGRGFLSSLGPDEQALLILGKPYHTAEPFLNMNLGSLVRRLGIKALPADMFPLESYPARNPIAWKHQLRMIAVARAIARDPRLFPVMLTFFGCGPDPFTVKHIKESLKGKPLLILEMDEHSSRAGLMTRLEAFLDHIKAYRAATEAADSVHDPVRTDMVSSASDSHRSDETRSDDSPMTGDGKLLSGARARPAVQGTAGGRSSRRIDVVYLPYFGDHSFAFAAAARSVGIEAVVLAPPDEESQRLGRPHLMGGECHPYALILGDYLKPAARLAPDEARRSVFCVPGYSACRLRQYPVYIDKIRKECGYSMRVIADLSQALTAFGLSKSYRDPVALRTWEGLNAYDVLLQAYLAIRPIARDPTAVEDTYLQARDHVFQELSRGSVVQALEDALHLFASTPVRECVDRPLIAVTGDYYTRIVPFANNEVFRDIEALGGTIRSPPTFSDGLKLYYLQEVLGESADVGSRDFEAMSRFYASMILTELGIKGSRSARRIMGGTVDPFGRRMRKALAAHMDPGYPPGMAAPPATVLSQVAGGADGVLNLITLNCSYGTVATATLGRVLKERGGVPMLTLVYDGLKKTNERTRLEAFMDQVHDRFGRR